MPKIFKEIVEDLKKEDNELYLLEERLIEVGKEWVDYLEKQAKENPSQFMKNATISSWIMNFFSLNSKEDKK